MTDAGNILLIRLKSIGDIVLTLPAVNQVRDNFPRARLAYLTSAENAPLVHGFAEVNEVLTVDRALFRRKNPFAICGATLDLVRRLRRQRFSLVIDFQGYGETALLTWLSGAPRRWGSVYRASRRWAYTKGPVRDDHIQIADWNLSLLQQCGLKPGPIRNDFRLPSGAAEAAFLFFGEHGLDPARRTIFIQPFTGGPQKNWPLKNYLTLAQHWRTAGTQVLFGGGPAESEMLLPAREAGFPISAGVQLLTSAGLMQLSTLVVGGVTGLLHLAVAMQKRVIMLIGYPAGEPGFPYQHRDWALTAGSAEPAASITVEQAIGATARALAEVESTGRRLKVAS
jgi:ADP-heptose:LPS heptosyltransferase